MDRIFALLGAICGAVAIGLAIDQRVAAKESDRLRKVQMDWINERIIDLKVRQSEAAGAHAQIAAWTDEEIEDMATSGDPSDLAERIKEIRDAARRVAA